MLDNGSLHIEGVMPGGAKNAYTLPVDVYCFGLSEAVRDTLQTRLSHAGEPGQGGGSSMGERGRAYIHAASRGLLLWLIRGSTRYTANQA
jgi:hypothetical protein